MSAPIIPTQSFDCIPGQYIYYKILASGSVTSWSASGLPAGLNFDPQQGLIYGVSRDDAPIFWNFDKVRPFFEGDGSLRMSQRMWDSDHADPRVGIDFSINVTASGPGGQSSGVVRMSVDRSSPPRAVADYTLEGMVGVDFDERLDWQRQYSSTFDIFNFNYPKTGPALQAASSPEAPLFHSGPVGTPLTDYGMPDAIPGNNDQAVLDFFHQLPSGLYHHQNRIWGKPRKAGIYYAVYAMKLSRQADGRFAIGSIKIIIHPAAGLYPAKIAPAAPKKILVAYSSRAIDAIATIIALKDGSVDHYGDSWFGSLLHFPNSSYARPVDVFDTSPVRDLAQGGAAGALSGGIVDFSNTEAGQIYVSADGKIQGRWQNGQWLTQPYTGEFWIAQKQYLGDRFVRRVWTSLYQGYVAVEGVGMYPIGTDWDNQTAFPWKGYFNINGRKDVKQLEMLNALAFPAAIALLNNGQIIYGYEFDKFQSNSQNPPSRNGPGTYSWISPGNRSEFVEGWPLSSEGHPNPDVAFPVGSSFVPEFTGDYARLYPPCLFRPGGTYKSFAVSGDSRGWGLAIRDNGTVLAWGAGPSNDWGADLSNMRHFAQGACTVPPGLQGIERVYCGEIRLHKDVSYQSNPEALDSTAAVSIAVSGGGQVFGWGHPVVSRLIEELDLQSGFVDLSIRGVAAVLKDDGRVLVFGENTWIPSPHLKNALKVGGQKCRAVNGTKFFYKLKTDEGTAVNWSASGLPSGLQLDAQRGIIHGVPLGLPRSGRTSVQITATAPGLSDSNTLFIESNRKIARVDYRSCALIIPLYFYAESQPVRMHFGQWQSSSFRMMASVNGGTARSTSGVYVFNGLSWNMPVSASVGWNRLVLLVDNFTGTPGDFAADSFMFKFLMDGLQGGDSLNLDGKRVRLYGYGGSFGSSADAIQWGAGQNFLNPLQACIGKPITTCLPVKLSPSQEVARGHVVNITDRITGMLYYSDTGRAWPSRPDPFTPSGTNVFEPVLDIISSGYGVGGGGLIGSTLPVLAPSGYVDFSSNTPPLGISAMSGVNSYAPQVTWPNGVPSQPPGSLGLLSSAYSTTDIYSAPPVEYTPQLPPIPASGQSFVGQVGVSFSRTVALDSILDPASNWSAAGLPPGLAINSSGVISGTPSSRGQFQVSVTASNSVGTGAAVVVPIQITGGAPIIQPGQNFTIGVGEVLNAAIVLNDAVNRPVSTWTFTNLPSWASAGGGVITGAPTAIGGVLVVNVRAEGEGGQDARDITITVVAGKPALEQGQEFIGRVGVVFQAAPASLDSVNRPVSSWQVASGSPLPVGLSINSQTGVISGTPLRMGDVTSQIQATNASGSGAALVVFRIAGGVPIVAPNQSATGIFGVPFAKTFVLTDSANRPAASWQASGLPAWATLDAASGSITGTPAAAGASSIIFTATGPGGASSPVAATITILAGPPEINPGQSFSGKVGQVFNATRLTLSDSVNGAASSWSVASGALPPGISMDLSGAISGIPEKIGTFSARIRAANEAGSNIESTTFVISPGAPLLISETITASVGLRVSRGVGVSNIENRPITTFSSDDLPAWITLNSATGAFEGTPLSVGIFAFEITATGPGGQSSATITLNVGAGIAYYEVYDFDTGEVYVTTPAENFVISNLDPAKTYNFELRACNGGGCSAPQSFSITTLPQSGRPVAASRILLQRPTDKFSTSSSSEPGGGSVTPAAPQLWVKKMQTGNFNSLDANNVAFDGRFFGGEDILGDDWILEGITAQQYDRSTAKTLLTSGVTVSKMRLLSQNFVAAYGGEFIDGGARQTIIHTRINTNDSLANNWIAEAFLLPGARFKLHVLFYTNMYNTILRVGGPTLHFASFQAANSLDAQMARMGDGVEQLVNSDGAQSYVRSVIDVGEDYQVFFLIKNIGGMNGTQTSLIVTAELQ